MLDPRANFAVSTVATPPDPSQVDNPIQALHVAAGEGDRFPTTPPFSVTVWPAGQAATHANAEILRVMIRNGDELQFLRQQEGTVRRDILAGDTIAATITAFTFDIIESAISERMRWAGAWAGQNMYSVNDVVTYDGHVWVAINYADGSIGADGEFPTDIFTQLA